MRKHRRAQEVIAGLCLYNDFIDQNRRCLLAYLHFYNSCLDKYQKNYVPGATEPLDLAADAQAPEELNVQIRVLDDGVGDIVTADSGTLVLKKGWVHTAKRTDVEQLIRAGKVEHVKSVRT